MVLSFPSEHLEGDKGQYLWVQDQPELLTRSCFKNKTPSLYLLLKAWYHLREHTQAPTVASCGKEGDPTLGEIFAFSRPQLIFNFQTMNWSYVKNSKNIFKTPLRGDGGLEDATSTVRSPRDRGEYLKVKNSQSGTREMIQWAKCVQARRLQLYSLDPHESQIVLVTCLQPWHSGGR